MARGYFRSGKEKCFGCGDFSLQTAEYLHSVFPDSEQTGVELRRFSGANGGRNNAYFLCNACFDANATTWGLREKSWQEGATVKGLSAKK